MTRDETAHLPAITVDLSVQVNAAPTLLETARWFVETPRGRACLAEMRAVAMRRPAREVAALVEMGRQILTEHPELEQVLAQMRSKESK